MIVTGIAFIVFWALVKVLNIDILMAAVVVGVAFILLGLLMGERPWVR